jgi:uncharacterized protein
MTNQIKVNIKKSQKEAMRNHDKQRLGCLRSMLAECKQVEVDKRIELDDHRILVLLDKMLKQRRDSISQFEAAGRHDLAATEHYEMSVIQEFLPIPLSTAEITQLIDSAMATIEATGMQDMGKVIGLLKPQLQGRADMGRVSQQIKARLSN